MKILIDNETQLSLEHIGYILDNMHQVESHLNEVIMYHTDLGINQAIVINKIEHEEFTEWQFKGASN